MLSELGLSNNSPIVVVGTPNGWGEEGRIAWNLLYWGADEVYLLDGGFPAWAADPTRPIDNAVAAAPNPPPGTFAIRLRPPRRAELPQVKMAVATGDRPILDARTREEYDGKVISGQRRGGHLPRSLFIPEQALYTKDGRYIGVDELKKQLELPKSAKGATPIAYCVGGVRSALLALLIEVRLGLLTANYDGSMWEWAADDELPLTKDR